MAPPTHTWVCRDCGEVHPDHRDDCAWLVQFRAKHQRAAEATKNATADDLLTLDDVTKKLGLS